ncbi:MAG: glycosyltransferase, partial [Patescibacteria group bacterium]|nr:glycosyltransferase [Patescibacteria group bacterium]
KEVKEGLRYCPDSAELHRVNGIILQHLHCYGEAKKSLETAVTLGSNEALSELGILCQLMSQFKEAVHWLDKYINSNPDNAPLNDLRRKIVTSEYYAKREPVISVTMIVKDEEEMLGQCLESIVDVADELVVVDTGSKDKTVEIAQQYGAKVYHHPWQNSFSEARNYSISKATGDWILIIDADEVLEKTDKLKARELKWHDENDCYCFAVYSQLPGHLGGVSQGKHYSPRLFKRREDIRYEGIVHNVLRMPSKTCMTEVGIYHFGYDLRKEKMEEKFQRSLALLMIQVKDHPDDPFVRFNLAQMYLSRDYYKEATEHAEKIVSLLRPEKRDQVHILLMGLYQLALINIRLNEFEKAKNYCKTALKIKRNYIDPLLALGWIYFFEENYKQSLTVLRNFIKYCEELNKGSDFNMIVLNKLGSLFEAYYLIGEIYCRQGRLADARDMLTKSNELNPYYWQTYKSLGMIAIHEHDDQSGEQLFEQAIKLGYLNAEKYGTTGAPSNEFAVLLDEYKKVLFRHIDERQENKKVERALAKIDELLN